MECDNLSMIKCQGMLELRETLDQAIERYNLACAEVQSAMAPETSERTTRIERAAISKALSKRAVLRALRRYSGAKITAGFQRDGAPEHLFAYFRKQIERIDTASIDGNRRSLRFQGK
jgi:hypothetical protein